MDIKTLRKKLNEKIMEIADNNNNYHRDPQYRRLVDFRLALDTMMRDSWSGDPVRWLYVLLDGKYKIKIVSKFFDGRF